MKHLFKSGAALLAVLALVVSGCSSSDEPDITTKVDKLTFDFKKADFSTTGEWIHCYDAAYDNAVEAGGLTFCRTASATEWDGVTYLSWKGFTPSISADNSNHAGEWVTYQWGAMPGIVAAGTGYLVACWDSQEKLTVAPDFAIPMNPSVKITSPEPFQPASIQITNACYTYYTMLYGDDFCTKFTSADWLQLAIHGVRDGRLTGTIAINLAIDNRMITTWQDVPLDKLGTVDMLYFQMTSSDTGQWGMNTPAYFCLGTLTLKK